MKLRTARLRKQRSYVLFCTFEDIFEAVYFNFEFDSMCYLAFSFTFEIRFPQKYLKCFLSLTSFGSVRNLLQKRAVFSRIKRAIQCKFQQRNKIIASSTRDSSEISGTRRPLRTGSLESGGLWANDRERVGTQALVELGVTTGLGLLFALLKQTWSSAVRTLFCSKSVLKCVRNNKSSMRC